MRHRIPHLCLILAFVCTLLAIASAAPAPTPAPTPAPVSSSTETLYRRQENGNELNETVVTQTVQTINTPSGLATETCTVTLTPVIGSNGERLVQVVRQCSIVLGAQSEPPSTTTAASTSSNAPPSSTSSPPPVSTSPVNPGVSVVGFSSVSNPAAVTTPSTTPPPPSTSKAAPNNKPSSTDGMSAAADNTTAAPSSSGAAAFQIPGKKISVLPIGLGIFAGISVIALIVVGLVTYERTKYRKIFRQRKLAEQGAGMDYN